MGFDPQALIAVYRRNAPYRLQVGSLAIVVTLPPELANQIVNVLLDRGSSLPERKIDFAVDLIAALGLGDGLAFVDRFGLVHALLPCLQLILYAGYFEMSKGF